MLLIGGGLKGAETTENCYERNVKRSGRTRFRQNPHPLASTLEFHRHVDGAGTDPTDISHQCRNSAQVFDAKVAGVRASTENASLPVFTAVTPNCSLCEFRQLTVDDVVAAIRQLSDKQCAADPLPTRLLKDNSDVLASFLVELFNRSMMLGVVPTAFKAAFITPLLKKSDMDPADTKSYRPISNLSVLSKLLERLVARQLISYLTASVLLPDLQSAYRVPFHRDGCAKGVSRHLASG